MPGEAETEVEEGDEAEEVKGVDRIIFVRLFLRVAGRRLECSTAPFTTAFISCCRLAGLAGNVEARNGQTFAMPFVIDSIDCSEVDCSFSSSFCGHITFRRRKKKQLRTKHGVS